MSLEHAKRFIEALTGRDDAAVTWQTFDDSRQKRRELARVLQGGLSEHALELLRLNEAGAGIFVCVNATDGRGRRAGNVTALRALFSDDDGGGRRDLKLPPSFIVRSVRGPQSYWLLRDGEPLKRFEAAQVHLAEALCTDRAVHDLPRVMRCPGFMHGKGAPVLVTFEAGDLERRFSIDDVLAAFPLPERARAAAPPSRPVAARHTVPGERATVVERARRYLSRVPPAIEGNGGDAHTLSAACRIVRGFDLADVDALTLLEEWNAGCAPPWSREELEIKIRNARRYGTEPIGGLLGVPPVLSPRAQRRSRLAAMLRRSV
jgi:hypothetical protein